MIRSGRAALLPAIAVLLGLAGPGRGDDTLRPGLFASWRIDLLSEGRRSDEHFSVLVAEEVEPELWRLDLERGFGDGNYRILYRAGGEFPAFDRTRIVKMSSLENGRWKPVDPAELTLLDRVREMESSLSNAEELGDTLVVLPDGKSLICRRLKLDSEGESTQDGESVRLRTHWKVSGEVWTSPEVPLGAWVRYREERVTKKYSEFGGQVFEGEAQVSLTEWSLESLTVH